MFNLFENLQTMKESENDTKIKAQVDIANSLLGSIKEKYRNYKNIMNEITDSRNYDFSYKMYDFFNSDNIQFMDEDDIQITLDDIANDWESFIEKLTNMKYDDIFTPDNNHGSYFNLNDDYWNFKKLQNVYNDTDILTNDDLLDTLNDSSIIGYYYEDFSKMSVNDELNVGNVISYFEDTNDNEDAAYEFLYDLNNELTQVIKDFDIELEYLRKIVDKYHELKNV